MGLPATASSPSLRPPFFSDSGVCNPPAMFHLSYVSYEGLCVRQLHGFSHRLPRVHWGPSSPWVAPTRDSGPSLGSPFAMSLQTCSHSHRLPRCSLATPPSTMLARRCRNTLSPCSACGWVPPRWALASRSQGPVSSGPCPQSNNCCLVPAVGFPGLCFILSAKHASIAWLPPF